MISVRNSERHRSSKISEDECRADEDAYGEAKQSCAGYVAEQGKLERELGEIIENEESIRMELEVSENLEKELNLRIEELHALLEKERDTESEQLKISEESHLSLAGMEQQNLFVSENISRIEEEIVKFQAELEELG